MTESRSNGAGLNRRELFITALSAAGVFAALFVRRGFWPFGSGSVLITDLYSQYAPLLYRFYDVVTGRANLFYEFRIAGGLGLYADTVNELVNPFNYLLLLFGRDRIFLALNILVAFYGIAAAVSADFFLQKLVRPTGRVQVLNLSLALSYAFSGYAAYNYQIIKWMIFPVIFPLYALSLAGISGASDYGEAPENTRRAGTAFALLTAWQLVLSIQLGFMALLFALFAFGSAKNKERRNAVPVLGTYTFAGILLAGAALVPNIRTLLNSARAGYTSYLSVMTRHGLDDLGDRLFQIAHPVLIALILYMLCGKLSRRKGKTAASPGSWEGAAPGRGTVCLRKAAALTVFLWITVLFEPANLLWHMGSYRCFPVRYAYMVLLVMAAWIRLAYPEEKQAALSAAPALFSLAASSAAVFLAVHYEERLAQAFSSLALTQCPAELGISLGILLLLLASAVFAAAASSGMRGTLLLPVLAASFCLYNMIFLPESYGIRRDNEEAYLEMASGQESAEPALWDFKPFDESLPRDSALVTGEWSLTSYLPDVPQKTIDALSGLGFRADWMATYAEGAPAEAEELLAGPAVLASLPEYEKESGFSLPGAEELQRGREGISAELDVRRARLVIDCVLPKESGSSVLFLPVVRLPGLAAEILPGREDVPGREDSGKAKSSRASAEITELFGGFAGIRLPEGAEGEPCRIAVTFRQPGLTAGICLSFAGLALLPAAMPAAALLPGVLNVLFALLHGAAVAAVYIVPAAGMALYLVLRVFFPGAALTEAFRTAAARGADPGIAAGVPGVSDAAAVPEYVLLSAEPLEEGMLVRVAGQNLARAEGAGISADSTENGEMTAAKAADGIALDNRNRWSSENNWDSAEHWLEIALPSPAEICAVRLYWERTNVSEYSVEYIPAGEADVQDSGGQPGGEKWVEAVRFTETPASRTQVILLDEPVLTGRIRLHTYNVRREEADLTLYYQNVSLTEIEVYGAVDSFVLRTPEIPEGRHRQMDLPEVPEGYALEFAGADYGMLFDRERHVADTEAGVEAEIGFALIKTADGDPALRGEDVRFELPGMKVTIPASVPLPPEREEPAAALPEGIRVAEWRPDAGGRKLIIPAAEAEHLMERAAARADEASGQDEKGSGEVTGNLPASGLESVEEAYCIYIAGEEDGGIRVYGGGRKGLRWGMVTLAKLVRACTGEDGSVTLPCGVIRDYPRYSVRGFGIDVSRRPVSLDTLETIAEELSAHRMNTLHVHLNDNQIITQSGYDGTVAGARNLYSAFRLDLGITGKDGAPVASGDLCYSEEEFAQFVDYAASLGVEVVPEIDTPAHSLALTKVFPEAGFARAPELADTLDLSKEAARELGRKVWTEALAGAAFEDCATVHLGGDEYYGRGRDYAAYMASLALLVKETAPEKKLRLWASLDYYGDPGLYRTLAQADPELEMQLWDASWADPGRVYGEGFSLINSWSRDLYILPGGGYDYLDTEQLQSSWMPNRFATEDREWIIPAYSGRMLGAVYMLWNDWADYGNPGAEESAADKEELPGGESAESGSDADILARFIDPLDVLESRLW